MSTSSADIIVLSSGEQLEVTVLEQTDSTLRVRHSILGDFTIQTSDISSLESSTQIANESETTSEDDVESIATLQEEEVKWNQKIQLGLGYKEGQKTSADLSTSYHADRTKDEHKITFDISYRFAESENERTLNRFASAWGNKWFYSNSRWDIFTTVQFDWAEFQSWDQRLLGDFGIGFEILKKVDGDEKFIVSTRLGSGFRKEFNSDNDDVIPEGLIGIGVDWTISSRQAFTAESTWYPDYEDTSNYRLVSDANWNVKLNMKNNLIFSIGFHHEYNSVVDDGVKKADLQLTAGIAYSF